IGQLRLRKLGHLAVINLGATVATVTRDEHATIGEGGDGALAVILTQRAVVAMSLNSETIEFSALP
ncbi:hypothetical protein, partial [Neisseria sp. P0014.S006]|uniref:hypothetical protein n=1 Tax=Neisseria sp. P0014.S006 TaxID=3436752 RepID=UPI003F7F3FF3